MRLFAVTVGALLSGLYLLDLALGPATWWPPDMTYGSVVACALVVIGAPLWLLIAAAAMTLSSVLVVASSLRLRRFRPCKPL